MSQYGPVMQPPYCHFRVGALTVAAPNVAVSVAAALIVTLHAPVPEQPPPLQPLKVDPPAALAVSVTTVPQV